jgi:hypothetical protein
MNDQPKPATGEKLKQAAEKGWDALAGALADRHKPTGEWTVAHDNMIYAGEVFVTLIKDEGDRGRVVQMHNAAIAGEREEWQLATEDCHRIISSKNDQLAAGEQQLAAELELHDIASKECIRLQKELAAEREEVKRLRSQLAASQAAMKQGADKLMELIQFHISGDPCHVLETVELLRSSDTTALDAAIAASASGLTEQKLANQLAAEREKYLELDECYRETLRDLSTLRSKVK